MPMPNTIQKTIWLRFKKVKHQTMKEADLAVEVEARELRALSLMNLQLKDKDKA